MTAQQITQHRDVYERLRALTFAPGDSYWHNGECVRRPFINKDDMTFDELLACPDTPRIAYLRSRYSLAGMLRSS